MYIVGHCPMYSIHFCALRSYGCFTGYTKIQPYLKYMEFSLAEKKGKKATDYQAVLLLISHNKQSGGDEKISYNNIENSYFQQDGK